METPALRSVARAVAWGGAALGLALGCANAATPSQDPTPPAGEISASASPTLACGAVPGGGPPISFQWPVNGRVTSGFGPRGNEIHRGIDISARRGMGVHAAAAGRVIFSDRKPNFGRVVILEHAGGYRSIYAHAQDVLVWDGTRVEQGELIAEVGASGNARGTHLHFEVRRGNRSLDPLHCLPLRTTRQSGAARAAAEK